MVAPACSPVTRKRSRLVGIATVSASLVMVPLAMFSASAAASPADAELSATWSASKVTSGKAVYVTGKVDPSWTSRTLRLQRKVPGGWAVEASETISGDTYKMRVPTGWVGSFRYRVIAGTNGAKSSTSVKDFKVVTSYTPRGQATDSTFMSKPAPRWDPCTPIRYKVNAKNGTKGALKDAKGAVRRITLATGLHFVYAGPTKKIPQGGVDEKLGRNVNLVIAWARPSQSKMLARSPRAAGVGGPTWMSGQVNGVGVATSKITQAQVVLNSTYKHSPGFAEGRYTRGQLLMHEIAHATGLGHATGRTQVMYPVMVPSSHWGAGDLFALNKVGANQGCVFDADDLRSTRAPAQTRILTDAPVQRIYTD